MNKHTPGPWSYREGLGWCDVYPHPYLHTKGTHLIEYSNPTETMKANARLIAMAPELEERVVELEAQRDALLDACKAALAKCPFPVGAALVKEQLQDAIAKTKAIP